MILYQITLVAALLVGPVLLVHLLAIPVAIVLERVEDLLGVGRHQIGPRLPQRMHNEVDEADLGLFHAGVLSIAHGTYFEAFRALAVALQEELAHHSVHPRLVQLERLGRIAQVGTVQHVLEHAQSVLIVLEHYVAGAGHFFRLHHRFQLGQQAHVLGHVGGQHHFDDHFANDLTLVLWYVGEDVARLVLQYFEGHRQMMILEHRLVIVHDGQLGARVDQVLVGEARMVDVVYGGREDGSEDFEIGEYGLERFRVE